MINMVELSEKAVETAKNWDLQLDYSAGSIASLEQIAQSIYQTNQSQHLPDHVLWNIAATYGAYLGETLLKNGLGELGLSWAENEEGMPVLWKDKGNWMSPVSKVYKRITNGPEDKLEGFYSTCFAFADGTIDRILEDEAIVQHMLTGKQNEDEL